MGKGEQPRRPRIRDTPGAPTPRRTWNTRGLKVLEYQTRGYIWRRGWKHEAGRLTWAISPATYCESWCESTLSGPSPLAPEGPALPEDDMLAETVKKRGEEGK